MKKHQIGHLEMAVKIGSKNTPCRLMMSLIPQQVYEQRIRKAEKHAKSKGLQVSNEYKLKARFNLFITNVPSEIIQTEMINEVYRVRWQIELVFKTWKSLLQIHESRPVKKHRFECQLIAKFIWILLNWKVFQCLNQYLRKESPSQNLSFWKFYKLVRNLSHLLRETLNSKIKLNNNFLECLYPNIHALLTEKKKGKISSHLILVDELLS